MPSRPPVRVCFLFNAQRHQMLHGVSVAVSLARQDGYRVEIVSPSAGHIAYGSDLVERMGGAPISFHTNTSPLMEGARRMTGASVPPKALTLLSLARSLNDYDAIALPERTSILLKRLGVRRPRFIHLDHGAGDRAAGFDPRIRLFDMVLMAGEKHRRRLSDERLIRPGHHAVVGYPKFEAADAVRDDAWTPFENDLPTVLYNPHFSRLGSWADFGEQVLRAFADQDRYNLILAPHVRLLDGKGARRRWSNLLAEFVGHSRIHIDTGSDRSIDMTYTTLADVYLGDVSSQVYEFLRRPGPCLFLDPHGVAWNDDPDYAHWRFGPVLTRVNGLIDAVDVARRDHRDFRQAQIDGFDETFATSPQSASDRAANAIVGYMKGWLNESPHKDGPT